MRKAEDATKPTCADLFAGAGGLTVGFHQAGFRSLFFNEIDAAAAATHTRNFPGVAPFVCPIQELTAADIRLAVEDSITESIDVMVGGPPCQGFSINAPARHGSDPRNHLFREYVRLVLEGVRPKFLVLENVPGLLSMAGGRTLGDVLEAFRAAGYRTAHRVLNAAHYGVPQERWRLFILATRLPEAELSFPMPRHYSLQRPNFSGGRTATFAYAIGVPEEGGLFSPELLPPTSVADAISDLPAIPSGGGVHACDYDGPPNSRYQKTMRQGSRKVLNHACAALAPINIERMRHVPPGGSWRDIPHAMLPAGMQRARRSDHTRRYGRLDPALPSGTIMTKCDPHWGTVVHYEQDRVLSVREAARIQSFPDWFEFTGSKADQYRQVGNAVPPLLAQAIAEHLIALMRQADGVHASAAGVSGHA